jgi:hypothetical protein
MALGHAPLQAKALLASVGDESGRRDSCNREGLVVGASVAVIPTAPSTARSMP